MVRWIAGIEGGVKRVNHAVVHISDTPFVLSFGGYCNGFDQLQYMDSHAFNFVTFRWTQLTPAGTYATSSDELKRGQGDLYLPEKRFAHTATAFGHEVYVIGGQKSHHPNNNVDVFDVTTRNWKRLTTEGAPVPRAGHTASVFGGLVYVFGGCRGLLFLNSIDIFDPKAQLWTQPDVTGDLPLPRDFHTAAAVDEFMYVFGGRSDVNAPLYTATPQYPNELFKYDVKMNSWHTVLPLCGNPPVGRRSHSLVSWQKRLYIFGGYNGILDEYFNDFHMFDTEMLMWSQMVGISGPHPSPRRRHGCCMIGDNQMLIYGGTSHGLDDDDDDDDDTEFDDLSDISILDFQPSLRTLSLIAVVSYHLDYSTLPHSLQTELQYFTQKDIVVY